MLKRNCVVEFSDSFGIERAAKVEAESLFEAAVRGLRRLDSSFWSEEDVFDRMCITVEVYEEPTSHTVIVANLKRWIKSHGRHPCEEAKKDELRKLLFGTKGQASPNWPWKSSGSFFNIFARLRTIFACIANLTGPRFDKRIHGNQSTGKSRLTVNLGGRFNGPDRRDSPGIGDVAILPRS